MPEVIKEDVDGRDKPGHDEGETNDRSTSARRHAAARRYRPRDRTPAPAAMAGQRHGAVYRDAVRSAHRALHHRRRQARHRRDDRLASYGGHGRTLDHSW